MHAAGVPLETAELQARVANLEAEVAQLTNKMTRLDQPPRVGSARRPSDDTIADARQ
jgi:hypothetical protein